MCLILKTSIEYDPTKEVKTGWNGWVCGRIGCTPALKAAQQEIEKNN